MDKWEYKTLSFDVKGFFGGIFDTERFQNEINKYGTDGWELISCFDTSFVQGGSRCIIAVMKRKIIK